MLSRHIEPTEKMRATAAIIGLGLITWAWGPGALGVAILVLLLEDTIGEDYAPYRKGRGPYRIDLSDVEINVNIIKDEEQNG